jgi:uracil phosphoribosyltransferase
MYGLNNLLHNLQIMITVNLSKESYNLYRIEESNLPTNTYILSSAASREILYNPHIAGKELQTAMERLSPLFMEAATEKALKGTRVESIAEFVLLAGGLYYYMARGFRTLHGYALPQCFLGIKRQRVEGKEGEFRAVSTYENFESLPNDATVIIGDTVATGATIIRAIKDLEAAAAEKSGSIKKLVICSLACSTEGARRLRKLEERMVAADPNFRLYLLVAEQLFHLMPDGTDLRFFKEDVIVPEETRKYTMERYGEFLGKEMKCAVFDWGTRCKNPKKHYAEFLEFCDEILKNEKLDDKGKQEIERMGQETLAAMKNLEKTI